MIIVTATITTTKTLANIWGATSCTSGSMNPRNQRNHENKTALRRNLILGKSSKNLLPE